MEVETSDDQMLVEAIAHLNQTTLADGQVTCQVCNETINEGDQVMCYLQSPAEQHRYDITQTRCTDHDNLTELLTLGVDELVIDGQIGCSSDQATQRSWPVLLVPRLRVVSSASTATGREFTVQPEYDHDPAAPLMVDIPQPTEDQHWNKGRIADNSEFQEATLDRWEQPEIDTTEGDR